MRRISCRAAVAAAVAAGLLLAPVAAFARGGGGGGFGRAATHTGFRATVHTGFRTGFVNRAAFAHHAFHPFHRFHRGFWGWGNVGFIGGSAYSPYYGPGSGLIPEQPDIPATDFYNIGIYTGGPYGFPLANGGYAASARGAGVAQSHGCETHGQMVPNTHHGLSRVTVVRC